ncbi:Uncharacterized protein Adt_33600 [Abeliophyllum distichum]|uniref:DUF4283 domain-containing protein n=1 Tax=Abeliophyllum distichum TaxID=126358 RepID=A0ABD1QWN5_9LAMI
MGCPMRILKWICDFHPNDETPIAPVWISFPLLRIHLRVKEFSFALSKIVGVSLRIYKATVDLLRPSEARACVEVNLEHKLPDRIWIDRDESLSLWQPIASKTTDAPAHKLVVAPVPKPVDVQVSIVDRVEKGKEKETVVEAPMQWVPIVGSSLVVDIPPPVVHVGTIHQPKHTIPTIVASKSFHDVFFF